ncbi:YbhB/YbcL family Raf kinase inhibitor-like protein [Aurantiacibacter poecillastricola]|uniref:YbhB/YbcL family Raf kinase inhibitor-like protein n=1 Tax=Aurantiacibacter poecillastricola TaxID=3064385 RepID=UPI00273F6B90|nr:YbhB/YbcL family Raf kinase inhibitor-like protein [Aurantiacibacter sp. 219JJ12-13]MDP5263494.1 YbhB/YbcL family Raf kinase inhibitor-like protein [Aurantiacibacter sp. 219JJ12-13]
MLENVPAWLGKALRNVRAGHGKLMVAKLGEEEHVGIGGFSLKSAAFRDGEELDPSFTADEEDAVAPPLEWSAPPTGTQELVLVVEDPDAPAPEPFCHWLVWGLPGQKGQLLEGEAPPRVGKNSYGNSEWLLPDPPTGHEAHDYVFQLFALDLPLVQMPGATRDEIAEAMKGHVIGVALLTGTYAREEGGDYDIDHTDGAE